jgi:hypothetical protein
VDREAALDEGQEKEEDATEDYDCIKNIPETAIEKTFDTQEPNSAGEVCKDEKVQKKFYEEEKGRFSNLKTEDKRRKNEQNTHSQQSHIEVLAFRILVKSL